VGKKEGNSYRGRTEGKKEALQKKELVCKERGMEKVLRKVRQARGAMPEVRRVRRGRITPPTSRRREKRSAD